MLFVISDNVHFQHSAQLIRALTESDVYFKTQVWISVAVVPGDTTCHQFTFSFSETVMSRVNLVSAAAPFRLTKILIYICG